MFNLFIAKRINRPLFHSCHRFRPTLAILEDRQLLAILSVVSEPSPNDSGAGGLNLAPVLAGTLGFSS